MPYRTAYKPKETKQKKPLLSKGFWIFFKSLAFSGIGIFILYVLFSVFPFSIFLVFLMNFVVSFSLIFIFLVITINP